MVLLFKHYSTLSNLFFNTLTSHSQTSLKNGDKADVYFNLFYMLEKDNLNLILDQAYGEFIGDETKEWWFTSFHKSIRQTEFFRNIHFDQEEEILTREERNEMYNLRGKLREGHIVKRNEDGEMTEEYKRYLNLNATRKRETLPTNVSGNINGILWSFIHLDGGFLHDVLLDCFEQYSFLINKKK